MHTWSLGITVQVEKNLNKYIFPPFVLFNNPQPHPCLSPTHLSISCPDHPIHNPPLPRRWRRRAKEWHMQIYLIGWKIGMWQGSLPWMFFCPTSQPLPPPCFNLLSFFSLFQHFVAALISLTVSHFLTISVPVFSCTTQQFPTLPAASLSSFPTTLPISPSSSFFFFLHNYYNHFLGWCPSSAPP